MINAQEARQKSSAYALILEDKELDELKAEIEEAIKMRIEQGHGILYYPDRIKWSRNKIRINDWLKNNGFKVKKY